MIPRVHPAGLNPLSFDPATNNEPLQFSGSGGPLVTDCPLENGTENGKKRKRPSLATGTMAQLKA